MNWIITSEVMRQCEEANFAAALADPLELMRIAGEGCAQEFLRFYAACPQCRRVVILSGHGNNGGDGIVMASVLAGCLEQPVVLVLVNPSGGLSPSAEYFYRQLAPGVQCMNAADVVLSAGDVVVDAMLGTGCRAPVREPYAGWINKLNAADLPVFAVDVPSGSGADLTVRADFTAVIGYFKDILFTGDGIENSGRLRRVELPLSIAPSPDECAAQSYDLQNFIAGEKHSLPRVIHKYQRGTVLICGGSRDYIQAPFLSARSALRSSAGMVFLAVPFAVPPGSGTLSVIPLRVPDDNGNFSPASLEGLQKVIDRCDVVAAGPGMGRSAVAAGFIESLIKQDLPLVLDADAIAAVSRMPELLRQRQQPVILTPHRGEAAILAAAYNLILTGENITDARNLARASGGIILLKGPRTAVAAPDGRVWVNTSGSPVLATAGSGDCLTGLIAAEWANKSADRSAVGLSDPQETALNAALRGAFLHGMAGELAEIKSGSWGMIADDLPELMAAARQKIMRFGDI